MAQQRLKPRLLDSGQGTKTYVITVKTRPGSWAVLEFSDRVMAEREHQRIRSQGIFGEQWINECSITEKISGKTE